MPQEKDRQDEEMDLMYGQGNPANGGGLDEQNKRLALAPSQASGGSRMGGRIGARMEGLRRTGEDEAVQNNNGDESGRPRHQGRGNNVSDDDDPQIEDDDMGDVGQVNDGNKVAREPEREPSKDPNYLIDGKKHENGQINSGPAGNGDDNQFNIDETINDGNAGHIN